MQPILHLSLPVHDLAETKQFYVETLGCSVGRERPDFIDIWFFGLQLTLQLQPDQVLPLEQRGVRHFGVTVSSDELTDLMARLGATAVEWVSPLHTDYAGTPQEQTKAKVADPSGNVIELKAYVDPTAAFETPPT